MVLFKKMIRKTRMMTDHCLACTRPKENIMWMILLMILLVFLLLGPTLMFLFPLMLILLPVFFFIGRPSIKVYTKTFTPDAKTGDSLFKQPPLPRASLRFCRT